VDGLLHGIHCSCSDTTSRGLHLGHYRGQSLVCIFVSFNRQWWRNL